MALLSWSASVNVPTFKLYKLTKIWCSALLLSSSIVVELLKLLKRSSVLLTVIKRRKASKFFESSNAHALASELTTPSKKPHIFNATMWNWTITSHLLSHSWLNFSHKLWTRSNIYDHRKNRASSNVVVQFTTGCDKRLIIPSDNTPNVVNVPSWSAHE